MPRSAFKILFGGLICLGLIWALRPVLAPPQGLFPAGWTYAQLVNNRYPFHLFNPAWLGDHSMLWCFAESVVRLIVIAISFILVLVCARLRLLHIAHKGTLENRG
jgi:hypothetical protein